MSFINTKYAVRCHGMWYVQFAVFVDSMVGNTTVFLLVALAAERYVAVVHPFTLQKRRVSPFTWSIFCVLLTWALATVLALPDIFAHSMEDLVFTENDMGIFALPKLCMYWATAEKPRNALYYFVHSGWPTTDVHRSHKDCIMYLR